MHHGIVLISLHMGMSFSRSKVFTDESIVMMYSYNNVRLYSMTEAVTKY